MAANTDGSVIIGVDLSLSQAEKKLKKLEGDIDKTGDKINDLTNKRDQARQDGIFQAGVLDEEKMKLEEIKSRLKEARAVAADKSVDAGTRQAFKEMIPNISTELSEQQQRVRMLQTEYNQTENAVKKYGDQILNANMELDKQQSEYVQLRSEIDRVNTPAERFKRNMKETGKGVEKIEDRLKRLSTRVMVFSVFTMGLRELRKWIVSAIQTNDEARQSIAQLKGALLTMVQPLVSVVIPAFITFVNVLTTVIATVAKAVSAIFGGTVEQSADAAKNLNSEQKALKGVGSEAKKAGKSLASFDEINQIQTKESAGNGGAQATEIAPDFSFMDSMSDELKEKLDEIAKVVIFIGLGFALWKIGSMIPGMLGAIATTLGLVLMAVGGLVLAWNGLTDAWENGVDWLNLAEMIGGVALAATALYFAFGTLAAGIALVVGGIAMLVTGFRDAMTNGWNLQNTLLVISGIFATGLGISLLTGSMFPALIAGIAAVLLALTVATGHGDELIQGIQTVIEGFMMFFEGVFTWNMELAAQGIIKIFEGIKTAVGSVVDGVKDAFLGFLNWLDEKTGGKFHDIIETAKITINMFSAAVHEVLDGVVEFITGVFTGDWKKAWEGLVKIFDGIIGVLATPFVTVINLIIDALNAFIRGMNKISFKAPDWVPGIGGKNFGINIPVIPKVQVPKLAQGAVIPPNREFLAVLGDQRNGTNIEAPISEIEDAVARGIASAGGGNAGRDITVILQLDRREFARAVYKANNEGKQLAGVCLVGGSA